MRTNAIAARAGVLVRRVLPVALALAAWTLAQPAAAASLTLVCLPVGEMMVHCREAAARWAAETGNEVRVVSADGERREPLEHYEDLFSVESPRIDVLAFPAGWGPALADDLVDLGTRPGIVGEQMLDAAVRLGRVRGRQIGAPQHLAVGMLFYRADLVGEAPATWNDLREAARRVRESGEAPAGEGAPLGLVFPAVPPGDLVAAALEWIASFGGDPLVDRFGRVAVDTSAARAALAMAEGWAGALVAPDVVDLDRAQALRLFLEGRAVFLRHWSTAIPAVLSARAAGGEGDAVPGATFVTAPLPRADVEAGRHPATLAVWYLGVSRHSRHQEAAIALLAYLVDPKTQKRAAIEHALAPTITSLYTDPEILAAQGWLAGVGETLDAAVVPPVRAFGAGYLEVVDAVSDRLTRMLKGELGTDAAVQAVDRALTRIQRGVFD